jgi:CheY-like chemotaxis protein
MPVASSPTFNSIVLTTDLYMVREFQERTRTLAGEFRFVPLSHGEKLAEFAQRNEPDAIFIDDAFVDPLNGALIARIRHALGVTHERKPCFAITSERSLQDLRSIIANGFSDVFTKPIDSSMFFQKLQVHYPQKRFLKENLLFSMNVSAKVDLALVCELVSASEYGAHLRVNRDLGPGELFSLNGGLCGPDRVECLTKVMSCGPADERGLRDIEVIFVGPRKELLKAVRMWIKQEYVKSRESRSS